MVAAVAPNLRRSRCGEAWPSLGAGRTAAETTFTQSPLAKLHLLPRERVAWRGPKRGIEPTVLLGRHLARRGFWGVRFAKSPEEMDMWHHDLGRDTADYLLRKRSVPSSHGNVRGPDTV